jgi:hypothetical protein
MNYQGKEMLAKRTASKIEKLLELSNKSKLILLFHRKRTY